MSITLTANYKEALAPEIVEMIDNLVEENEYPLEDVLEVYDHFGEGFLENLEEILECMDITGSTVQEMWDFAKEFDVSNLEYYEDYKEAIDNYNEDAVKAYISCCDISDVKNFQDAYEGEYDRVEDFVEYILEGYGESIPSWVVIDAEATWNCSLRHDYWEENGFYFRNI